MCEKSTLQLTFQHQSEKETEMYTQLIKKNIQILKYVTFQLLIKY